MAFGQGHQDLARLDFRNLRTLLSDFFLTPLTRNHTIFTPIASPTPSSPFLTSPRKYDECIAEPGLALELVSPSPIHEFGGYRTRRAHWPWFAHQRLGAWERKKEGPFLEQEPERAQELILNPVLRLLALIIDEIQSKVE